MLFLSTFHDVINKTLSRDKKTKQKFQHWVWEEAENRSEGMHKRRNRQLIMNRDRVTSARKICFFFIIAFEWISKLNSNVFIAAKSDVRFESTLLLCIAWPIDNAFFPILHLTFAILSRRHNRSLSFIFRWTIFKLILSAKRFIVFEHFWSFSRSSD